MEKTTLEQPASMPDVTAKPEFTEQAVIGLFDAFESAVDNQAGATAAVMHQFLRYTLATSADVAHVKRATKAVVESTRVKVAGTDAKGKPTETTQDGPRTPLARKFASMSRAMYGAVRFANINPEEIYATNGSQAIYDLSRRALDALTLDWQGISEAEKTTSAAKKALAKAAKEVAGDVDPLALSQEEFATLRQKAAEKVEQDAMVKALEKMESRALKIASDLVKGFGVDDAEIILKRALEALATGEYVGQ